MVEQSSSSKVVFWTISTIVIILPVYIWADFLSWNFTAVSISSIFPLLGLLAYSILWLQMFVVAVLISLPTDFKNNFFLISGLAFLLLIIAHPLLLSIAQYQIGQSIIDYVGDTRKVFITLAITAWVIFILYEIFRRFKKWKFFCNSMIIFKYLNYVAFYLIFFHSINLGTNLQEGPLKFVWYFYALSGLLFIYLEEKHNKKLT